MATDVDRGWSHEDLLQWDVGSQEVSDSKVLDHSSSSFGRFAFESLEWERRSVFTYNKCQEELEKFKSPGLVAKKKAYFEEFYKRVRALKDMQENQQTEITLAYGGDRISSQSVQDDETTAHIESLGYGSKNIKDYHLKGALSELTLEKKHNCEATQIRCIDLEPTSSYFDSSRTSIIGLNQGKNNSGAIQIQHLDSGTIMYESIEQNDHSDFSEKQILRKNNISGSNFMREMNSGCDFHIGHIDRESIDRGSSIRREETGKHQLISLDVNGISRKCDNLEANFQSEVSTEGTVVYPANRNVVKSDGIVVSEKNKPASKKYKEAHMPIFKIKSSLGPKYSFKNTISKTKISADSSITTSDTVPRNHKATPVASHKPIIEVRRNITIPRPFSFATERRAAVTAGSRDVAPRLLPKTPNKLATSLNQAKDVINVQDSMKKAARAYGVKNLGTENKSDSEEGRKIALYTGHKEKGADVPGTPNARLSKSVNLISWNYSNPNGGSDYRSNDAVRKDKQEERGEGRVKRLKTLWLNRNEQRLNRLDEGKDVVLREVRGTGKTVDIPPQTGNLKAVSRKVASSQTGLLPCYGRRAGKIGLSRDGIKLRQEMPRWRY